MDSQNTREQATTDNSQLSDSLADPTAQLDTEQPDLSKRNLLLNIRPRVAESHRGDTISAAEAAPQAEPALYIEIANYIRSSSRQGKLVHSLCFGQTPFSVPQEALDEAFELISCQPDCQDILTVNGTQDRYYYCEKTMATNYAQTLVALQEQDSCQIIAQAIRFDCETYPRPYKLQMLRYAPYLFSESEIEAALNLMSQRAEYQDIQRVVPSNDEPYLFSSRFMSYGKAKGLCEWIEVEQHENP